MPTARTRLSHRRCHARRRILCEQLEPRRMLSVGIDAAATLPQTLDLSADSASYAPDQLLIKLRPDALGAAGGAAGATGTAAATQLPVMASAAMGPLRLGELPLQSRYTLRTLEGLFPHSGGAGSSPAPVAAGVFTQPGGLREATTVDEGVAAPGEDALRRWHRAQVWPGSDLVALLEQIRQDPQVEWAEPVYHWEGTDEIPPPVEGLPNGTTDPAFDDQWHHINAKIPQAWGYLKDNGENPGGRRDVVVAVIDTGVDYTHRELAGNMWVNAGEIPGNNIDDDGNGFVDDIHGVSVVSDARSESGDPVDLHGHGTHVAGIIAAQAFNGAGGVGIGFNTQIMAIRAAQFTGILSTEDIAEGILYAVDNGADVINMSFGGYQRSQVVEDALAVAFNRATLVAAAGNDGVPSQVAPLYPAALPYVLGVEASTPANGLAFFSNNGPHYEVRAPGTGIHSTLPGDAYAAWSGTSMAAPVVSGVAALMRSFFFQRDVYSNRFIMASIAANQTGGVIDAYKALTEPPTPGVVMFENWLFDDLSIDPDNDADGRVDAGDKFHLGIELINRAGQAEEVVSTLRARTPLGADDPYVTIEVGTVGYGSIGPFSRKDNQFSYDAEGILVGANRPFVISVDSQTPNNHVIPLELTTTFRNGWDPDDTTLYTRVDRFQYVTQRGRDLPRVISDDLTLTADDYWIVSGPVLVEAGATLRIEPGTQVQWGGISDDPFNPGPQNGNLVVRGSLVVAGTEADPVSLFPSELVSAQTTSMQVDGGVADLSYVHVLNPNLTGLRNVDHAEFIWDRYSSNINAVQITNSAFRKFRGGGSISAGRLDTTVLDSGRINPTSGRIENTVFLQDNEAQSPLRLNLPLAFRDNLVNDRNDLAPFYHAEVHNGDTYVLLPMEVVSPDVAELIANHYGGHLASVRSAEENQFLRDYLNRAPGFRDYGSSRNDWYYIGLSDRDQHGNYQWLDGSPLTFTDWADGFPRTLSPATDHVVQALRVSDNGRYKEWGWRNVDAFNSYRTGFGGRDSWNTFVLRIPGEHTIDELAKPFTDGAVLDYVIDNYESDILHNAFLNPYWDVNLSHWMRVHAPGNAADGYAPIQDNYWGTGSTTLIDHAIVDYYDNFTSARVEYGTPPSTGFESTYPFVQNATINGTPIEQVPTIGAGPATFQLKFNRDMDMTVHPLLTFGPSTPFTDFQVQPKVGGWIDPRTWEGEFFVTPVTGDGGHFLRISGARAADDQWLVVGDDTARFRFEVETMGVAALTLQAVPQEGRVDLSWQQDDFELLAGYHLYRSASPDGPFTRINASILPVGQESYSDYDVQPAVPMYYKFTVAQTGTAGESAFSNVASAAPLDTVPPAITHAGPTHAVAARSLRLTAQVTDNASVADVRLYYREAGAVAYTQLPMVRVSGNEWSASIPSSAVMAPGVEYYLTASDGRNEVHSGTPLSPHTVVVASTPTLSTVSPSRGAITGGQTVTLSGTLFQAGAEVFFGDAAATAVTVLSDTQITAVTPAHIPAQVDVRVRNPDGSQAVRLAGYRYQDEGVVLGLPQTTGDAGTFVDIPLEVSNVSGLISAEVTIVFDPAVLTPQSAQTAALSSGWSLAANTAVAGQVRLTLAGAAAASGSGALATVRFAVIGQAATQTMLDISQATLNDGAITAALSDGRLVVNDFFTVSGTVAYFTGGPVPGATLDLVGSGAASTTTSGSGQFAFADVATGSYTLTPAKTGDAGGITAFDASLVLQAAAALRTLTAAQQLAADVNRNGVVTAMDAAYILQKSVDSLALPFPGAGRVWDFTPQSRSYALLNADQSDQNFTAILLGDVSGSWTPVTPPPITAPADSSFLAQLPIGAEPGGGMIASEAPTVRLTLPDVRDSLADTLTLPLDLQRGGADVYSVDLVMQYAAEQLGIDAVTLGSAAAGASLAVNADQPGMLRIALASAQPLSADGPLLSLQLRVLGDVPQPTVLAIAQAQVNEGAVNATTRDASIIEDLPPTDIQIDSATVDENAAGMAVGNLTALDPNLPADTAAFALVPGDGDTDNGLFQIVGNQLRVRSDRMLDYETRPQLSVRVRATDSAELTLEKSLSISVNDLADNVAPAAPTGLRTEGGTALRPTLRWDPVAGASRYSIWFVNMESGQLVSAAASLVAPEWTPEVDLESGFYRLFVRSSNRAGLCGWGGPLTLGVGPSATVPFPPVAFQAAGLRTPYPVIQWTPPVAARFFGIYLVNMTTGQAAASNTNHRGSSYHFTQGLTNGPYRLFVRGGNVLGLGPWGMYDFTVDAPPHIPAPPVGFSASQLDTPRPRIQWQADPVAETYAAYLVNMDTGTATESVLRFTGTSYTPGVDLVSGNYRVFIRASNYLGTGYWGIFDFRVTASTASTAIGEASPLSPQRVDTAIEMLE